MFVEELNQRIPWKYWILDMQNLDYTAEDLSPMMDSSIP
jgi:hypothetical protein